MISTVTTAVSTIVSSSAATNLAGILGLCAVVFLVASLAVQQLAANQGVTLKYFTHNLWVITAPLLFIFSVSILTIIWEILR